MTNFNGNPTSGTAPLTVQFTDQSTGNPTSWAWDFQGDGIVDSTQKNPQFTYTTPGSYTVSLTVSNAAGSSTNTKMSAITVTAQPTPPTITSFTPTSGPVGRVVTISGSNYSGTSAVSFNGTAASFPVSADTQLTAPVPPGATSGPIRVTTPAGTATSASSFTVTPPPMISSFSPTSGPVGTSVTISGSNFSGATAVTFSSGTAASVTLTADTQITTPLPGAASTAPSSAT